MSFLTHLWAVIILCFQIYFIWTCESSGQLFRYINWYNGMQPSFSILSPW